MEAEDSLLSRVAAQWREAAWLPQGAAVVAAVSGGPDSMALLHMLKTLAATDGFRLIAAHVNHQFRGEEAAAEAELVRQTAARWDISFALAEIDMPAYIASSGLNGQEASREKRYAFLRETARRFGATKLALGHHADDQAETVLMRLLRGSGIGGLAGIPLSRSEQELELIRPLLRITKHELLLYNKRNGIPYALDSSNASLYYHRNAIRHEVIPALEQYNPQLKTSLVRLAELASADHDYLEAEAGKALHQSASPMYGGWTLNGHRFRGLHLALQRRMIKLILNGLAGPHHAVRFEQVDDIVSALTVATPQVIRFDVGSGLVLIREYDFAYIGPALPAQADYEHALPIPPEAGKEAGLSVEVPEPGLTLRLTREAAPQAAAAAGLNEALLDAEAIELPLIVRNRRPGDRMEPLGLNGSKKVQDMFVDAKIPRTMRQLQPLIMDGTGRVLWIPGIRRSKHAMPDNGTRSVIRIACEPSAGGIGGAPESGDMN